LSPIGYETDIVKLYPQTTLVATGTTTGPAFGASDWQRGYIYGVFGTIVGSPTVLPFLQVSPDGGTTWIGASGAAAAGLITNPLNGTGTAITAITAVTGASFIVPVNGGFPGSYIRLALTAAGTVTSCPIIVYGDFQKWVADNS
jgi:hypothetical protein